MRGAILGVIALAIAAAQDPPQRGAISGMVKDAATGSPLPHVNVSVSGVKGASTTSDEQGRFRVVNLPGGKYTVYAQPESFIGPSANKTLTLGPGQELDSIVFTIQSQASISGKVLDANKEPMPGMFVLAVDREYFLGEIRYKARHVAITNDRGEFQADKLDAGRAWYLVAEPHPAKLSALSDAPVDPKLRRPAFVHTWYPNASAADSAEGIVLRPGEHRTNIDIQVQRGPSRCIEGILEARGRPAPLTFIIEPGQPTQGMANGSGTYFQVPQGIAGEDGRIRLCDLAPGQYRFTAWEASSNRDQPPPSLASAMVVLDKEDIRDFRVASVPTIPLSGEVTIDGAQPEKPVGGHLTLDLELLVRGRMGEDGYLDQVAIPGPFAFPAQLMGDYAVDVGHIPSGYYLKEVTYSGVSILHAPLHLGTAMGDASLRVVLGSDGGHISVKVADKDGNAVPDSLIYAVPASVTSEAAIWDAVVSGHTDQYGSWQSRALAPGKYLVIATDTPVNPAPESVGRLWRSRNRMTEIEIPRNGESQARLECAHLPQ